MCIYYAQAGDVLGLDKSIGDQWMLGSLGQHKGMFPVNFVDVKQPPTIHEDSQVVHVSTDEDNYFDIFYNECALLESSSLRLLNKNIQVDWKDLVAELGLITRGEKRATCPSVLEMRFSCWKKWVRNGLGVNSEVKWVFSQPDSWKSLKI